MVNFSNQVRSLWQNVDKMQWPVLMEDRACDVAIVGGEISGIATLYYLMTKTDKRVVLGEGRLHAVQLGIMPGLRGRISSGP